MNGRVPVEPVFSLSHLPPCHCCTLPSPPVPLEQAQAPVYPFSASRVWSLALSPFLPPAWHIVASRQSIRLNNGGPQKQSRWENINGISFLRWCPFWDMHLIKQLGLRFGTSSKSFTQRQLVRPLKFMSLQLEKTDLGLFIGCKCCI